MQPEKKLLDNRDFSAVEQWDHLAQTLILKELAPKVKALTKEAESYEALCTEYRAKYLACPFWKLKERKRLFRWAHSYCAARDAFQDAIVTLTNMDIK